MKYRNNEKGSALLITIMILGMLTIVATMSANRSINNIEISFNQLHEEQSFYVAEAGIKRAFFAINDDPFWRTGYANETFGQGVYSVVIRDSSTNPGLDDTVLIQSAGGVDGSNTFLEAWTAPLYKNPFEYAMFAEGVIELKQAACTDSYRSDSGSYAATMEQTGADIGSNDYITLTQDAIIGGDVTSAQYGGIIGDGTVLGDTLSGIDSVFVPEISQDEMDWAEANSLAPSGFLGSGYFYDAFDQSLTVNANDTVILTSGTYYISELTMNSDSKLLIAPGAEVTIYMSGNITMHDRASLNPQGSPADLVIYSNGSAFSMFQDTEFYAGFYGPNTTFKGRQDIGMYGALVAADISFYQNACMHYDRTFSDYKKPGASGMLIVGWREM